MSVQPSRDTIFSSSEHNEWLNSTSSTMAPSSLYEKATQHNQKVPLKPPLTMRQKTLVLTMYILSLYVVCCQLAASAIESSSRASLRALILVSRAVFGAVSVHVTANAYHAINKRLKEDGSVLCAPSVTSSWTGTGELKPRCGKATSRKPRRLFTKLFILVYCLTLVATVISDQILSGEPRVGFGSRLWWNSSLSTTTDGLRHVIQAFDAGVGSAVLVAPCASIYWYIGICSWAHHRVIYLRERMYSLLGSEEQLSAMQLRGLQNIYQQLWSAISFLDDKLGKAVFIWHADLVANIILGVRVIQKADHWLQSLESLAHVVYAVVFFFLISVVAANVVVESRNIDYDLCRLVCRVDATDWQASNQIMLLQEEIQHCPLAFTGWKCFTLDRGYILTVAGAIITYAVVLQQLT